MSGRQQQIEDHISRLIKLLGEYEQDLLYSDDPKQRARCRREIEQIRKSMKEYEKELEEMRGATTQEIVEVDQLNRQFGRVNRKIDRLLADIPALRHDLLARFDQNERTIVSDVVDRLSEQQLQLTNRVLETIEAGNVSQEDMSEAVREMGKALAEIQAKFAENTPSRLKGEVQKAREILDDAKLGVTHKLKICLPIVPGLLSYEGEVNLGQNVSLSGIWERMTGWGRVKR